MDSKIHVVQATVSNDRGGLTGYILHNYRLIDKEKFEISLLTYENELDFKDTLPKKGEEIVLISKPTKLYQYYKCLKNIRKNRNDIIHFNLSYANFVPVVLARLAGYKNVIVHSHSTEIDDVNNVKRLIKKAIHFVGKHIVVPNLANDYWSCSDWASSWMFSSSIIKKNKVFFAHNAISLNKYIFDKSKRERKRKELNLQDSTICLGHIGRFSYQKNHEFLIEILNVLIKKGVDAKLLLIGGTQGGESYFESTVAKIKEYSLEDSVLILGIRDDVPDILQAMDWFLLPSRFEGLGIVGIEAQASGLSCIFSDLVPSEVMVHNNTKFLTITDSKAWADYIYTNLNQNRVIEQDSLVAAGYSDKEEILKVESRYKNIVKTIE